jgi:hypothetical protein
MDSGPALKVALDPPENIIINLPEPPLTNLKTNEKSHNRHLPSDIHVEIHASFHVVRYN